MAEESTERWLPVEGFDGMYEVSDQGQVRSYRAGQGVPVPHLLKCYRRKDGYFRAALTRSGKLYYYQLHRLVLETFVSPAPSGMEGCHNDGDKANNCLSNLRWDTRSANIRDNIRLGVHRNGNMIKTHCKRGHEFTAENTHLHVAATGTAVRLCKACRLEASRASEARRPPRKRNRSKRGIQARQTSCP